MLILGEAIFVKVTQSSKPIPNIYVNNINIIPRNEGKLILHTLDKKIVSKNSWPSDCQTQIPYVFMYKAHIASKRKPYSVWHTIANPAF